MYKSNYKISVSGLGYVGLPVLVAFSKINKVIGFDINSQRVDDLKKGWDKNNEVDKTGLKTFLAEQLPNHMMPKRIRVATVNVGHRIKRA